MFDNDPDGTEKPILNSTVQSFELPAGSGAELSGSINGNWEQAAVVYVDGAAQEKQIGNSTGRDLYMQIAKKSVAQAVTVVGWHKRGGPDPGKPWVASRGMKGGSLFIAFDDSVDDGDFDDLRIKVDID